MPTMAHLTYWIGLGMHLQCCCNVLLLSVQVHPMLQVVLCTSDPIEIPALECVTYELEDLGVDNVAQVLTSIAPQVCPAEQGHSICCKYSSMTA